LVEHTPAHIARIGGTFRAWVDGAETPLPPSPYPWFVSFPRDESSLFYVGRTCWLALRDPDERDSANPPFFGVIAD
jgi:hypothetical protein